MLTTWRWCCHRYIIAYLAALKAGGAYMPLELAYPPDLLARVCENARPHVVVTKPAFASRLPSSQTTLLVASTHDEAAAAAEAAKASEATPTTPRGGGAALKSPPSAVDVLSAAPGQEPVAGLGGWLTGLRQRAQDGSLPHIPTDAASRPTPSSLAYVVMSSGTTGVPKGIMCPHRGAVHSYHWRHVKYPFIPEDRVGVAVFFVWECIRPLLRGIPTYVIPDDVIYDPEKLAQFCRRHRITRMLVTPSLLQLLVDSFPAEELVEHLATMRIMWLCGEVVTVELAKRFTAAVPHCQLLNLYSISECHDVSVADLGNIDTTRYPKYAPCGRVMENVHIHVLDAQRRPVPVGSDGEVYVGGPCIARGYLNNPQQTARRFVRSPFISRRDSVGSDPAHAAPPAPHAAAGVGAGAGAAGTAGVVATTSKAADGAAAKHVPPFVEWRLYRTGDRGRFAPDGTLEVLGRCDFMVKIRGYVGNCGAYVAVGCAAVAVVCGCGCGCGCVAVWLCGSVAVAMWLWLWHCAWCMRLYHVEATAHQPLASTATPSSWVPWKLPSTSTPPSPPPPSSPWARRAKTSASSPALCRRRGPQQARKPAPPLRRTNCTSSCGRCCRTTPSRPPSSRSSRCPSTQPAASSTARASSLSSTSGLACRIARRVIPRLALVR